MTIVEIDDFKLTIEEMRDEIVVLRERGCNQVVMELDVADRLVAIALGVVQLDEMSRKIKGKVQR